MTIGIVKPVRIEEEVKVSYLDYAMSVIISRALPDIRDGLKPVHRRILYAMNELGIHHTSPYKKCARIVGEVLGKYHPHGDAPVYESLVRMAQDFSMRYVLVEGQGNFGSLDRDPPAAMRYTEARLSAIAQEMLIDIDKDTVKFTPNFDDTLQEPVVLPARIPNLLVNGSSGIAVGMATNIPPHNLSEVCDAIAFLINNPETTVAELIKFIPGPDFPTGGIIFGRDGLQKAYSTGQGKIVIRAKAEVEEMSKGRHQIVITEIPYQTNKAELVERIANLVKVKRIEGISDLRDESDRQGMRIIIELKREAQPEQVLNNLYKYTAMQSAFFINMLALVDEQPRVVNLKELLQHYINFRHEVIVRRSKFELKVAKERAHILEGLKIALDNLDAVIRTIRQSDTAETARQRLMANFGLTQIQAQAILDMQLRRLASLERQKILDEYEQLLKTINYLEELLSNPKRIYLLIKDDVNDLKAKYGDARRTQIVAEEHTEFREVDLIPHQRLVVTLSSRGYVKSVPVRVFTPQHRGGKGIIGMVTRETDAVKLLVVADTHDRLLFFTNRGKVYSLKCHEIPIDTSRIAKGIAIINLFPIAEGERITAMVPVADFHEKTFILMATANGEIKKTAVTNFEAVRSSGLIATDLPEGDELVATCLATDKDEVILVTQQGQSIRFNVSSLRDSSRTSGGVRGIRLGKDDKVVSMDRVIKGGYLLVATSFGFGKLTSLDMYPKQHRAGGGVLTFHVIDKSGEVVAARVVADKDLVMIISAEGIVTCTPTREKDPRQGITIQGRSTQGVRLMRLGAGDRIVTLTAFSSEEEKGKPKEKEG